MNEIFAGNDGKPSGRRIIGTIFFALGAGLAIVAQVQGVKELLNLAPAGLCIFVGLYLWGLVTVQNIKEIMGRTTPNQTTTTGEQ